MKTKTHSQVHSIEDSELSEWVYFSPRSAIHWGLTCILVLASGFILLGNFVEYSDRVTSAAIVTTYPAPQSILSKAGGHLQLLKNENDQITKNELIGVISDDITMEQINELEEIVLNRTHEVASFEAKAYHSVFGAVIMQLQDFIYIYDHLMSNAAIKYLPWKAIAGEPDDETVLPDKIFGESIRGDFLRKYYSMRIRNSRSRLLSEIGNWKASHILLSPSDGKLIFAMPLRGGLYVPPHLELFYVVPITNSYQVVLKIPNKDTGTISPGDQLEVELDEFPSSRYGALHGTIQSISGAPYDSEYTAIALVNGSSFGRKPNSITLTFELSGTAKIFTQKRSYFRRLFDFAE